MALCAVTAAATVSLTYVYAMNTFNERVADVNQRQAMYAKLSEIDQTVRQGFVGEIDETALLDGICNGYVAGLGDSDAKYLSAERYQAYLNGTSGKTVGVGINTVKDSDGNMEITEVIPNSPAETAGLHKGDVIVSIDDKEVVRVTYGDAVNLLEGALGSQVKFSVLRPAETEETQAQLLTVTVTRQEYTRRSVTSGVINGNVGYIRISQFQESTPDQFQEAMASLKESGVCGLVLDLRNNSGGNMEAAASILDTLLPAGTLVSSRDSSGTVTVEYSSRAGEYSLPISVVINGSTFGAAELFAADVREYNKGLLIGDQTAGYGRKSQVVPLSDGSAVSFSVAEYLTTNGTAIDGEGVAPDITKLLTAEQKDALVAGELAWEEDPQILSAVTALVRQGAEVQIVPGDSAGETGEEALQGEESGEEGSGSESSQEAASEADG